MYSGRDVQEWSYRQTIRDTSVVIFVKLSAQENNKCNN